MTQTKDSARESWKEIFASGPDGLRALLQEVVQEVLASPSVPIVMRQFSRW